mgnify:CR=1 FL=1
MSILDTYGYIRVWDTNTLSWIRMEPPTLSAGTVAVSGTLNSNLSQYTPIAGRLPVDLATTGVVAASGQVSASGNNTLVTPASGKKLRLFYVSYNPLLAIEAAFRFGASGSLWLRNNITANSVIAKDFGAFRSLEGAVDQALLLNLSLAVSTNWNVFYVEV